MLNVENIKRIYNALADDESKRIYNARLLLSLTGDDRNLVSILEEYSEKYFLSELWEEFVEKLKADKTPKYIFGCGEYGNRLYKNTKDVITWNGFIDRSVTCKTNYGDVYIYPFQDINFDMEANYYLPSKTYFYEMKNQLLAMGVKNENIIDATVLYDLTEGLQYFDLEELPHVNNEVFVDCGASEGAELETIKGAKRIIKEYKPKLAICIYHKDEDIWQIPTTILDIRDDYKFYIRHYSFGPHETVLYAI